MDNKIPSTTMFFPAFNEEGNIERTIRSADSVAQRACSDYEILIINDGSLDKTQSIVGGICKELPSVRLINHPTNLGYGAALTSGFANATKEWTFFSDGDGQFYLEEIQNLFKHSDRYDVIIGYRLKRHDLPIRLLNAWGWKVLNRALFSLKVRDIDCAFKLVKTSAVKKMLPDMVSKGAMFSAELLVRLIRNGHDIKEVGVRHKPRIAGVATGARFGVIIRAFKEMATLYRGDFGHQSAKKY